MPFFLSIETHGFSLQVGRRRGQKGTKPMCQNHPIYWGFQPLCVAADRRKKFELWTRTCYGKWNVVGEHFSYLRKSLLLVLRLSRLNRTGKLPVTTKWVFTIQNPARPTFICLHPKACIRLGTDQREEEDAWPRSRKEKSLIFPPPLLLLFLWVCKATPRVEWSSPAGHNS